MVGTPAVCSKLLSCHWPATRCPFKPEQVFSYVLFVKLALPGLAEVPLKSVCFNLASGKNKDKCTAGRGERGKARKREPDKKKGLEWQR